MTDTDNSLNSLPDRIKFARKKLNISQTDLADIIGVSQGTIGHIESGRSKDSKWIIAIAKALNVTVEWLVYGNANTSAAVNPFILFETKDYLSLPRLKRLALEKNIIKEIKKIKINKL